MKLNTYKFLVIDKHDRRRIYRTKSKHLNGAVRKLYQTYDIKDVIQIW